MQYTGPNGEVVISNGSQAGDSFLALYAQICAESQRKETEWITELRAHGVKAAHPDDGWVDRERNTVTLAYPQFNDGLQIGDVIALGRSDRHRLVQIEGITERFNTIYSFKELTEQTP